MIYLIVAYAELNLLVLMIISLKIYFTGEWPIKRIENATTLERAISWLFFPVTFILNQLVDYGVRNSYRLDGYSYDNNRL